MNDQARVDAQILWRLSDDRRRKEKMRVALNNRIAAAKRSGMALDDEFLEALATLNTTWKKKDQACLREIALVVKGTPIYGFIQSTRGLGAPTTGLVMGALSSANYIRTFDDFPSPGKLWRWFLLDVSGAGEAARPQGFQRDIQDVRGGAPWRKSLVVKRVVDPVIKTAGPYRTLYEQRKAYEVERNEAGVNAERAAVELARKREKPPSKAQRERWESGRLTDAHLDLRARRYVAKRILRDLWRAWRDAQGAPTEH